jgi:hypothetical protein
VIIIEFNKCIFYIGKQRVEIAHVIIGKVSERILRIA